MREGEYNAGEDVGAPSGEGGSFRVDGMLTYYL